MLQPRFAWRTPAHQADVRFLQILCFALYYRSLWASYESLRTHQKNDSASCYFFAVEGVPFPTHQKNDSASCYFFAVEGVPFPTHQKNDSASCFFLRSKAYRFLRTTKIAARAVIFLCSQGLLQLCCNHAMRGEPRHTRTMFAFAFKIRSYSQLCLFQKQVAKRAGRCYNRIYIIILKGFFILCHKTLSINFASADL